MEPHAHSELIKNNEDKPRTVYMNQRIDGLRIFSSCYTGDKSTKNIKECGCPKASETSVCNECRSVTEEVCWTDTRHTQNVMCKNPTISHASYCHENTTLIDEPIIRNKTIIATSIESKTSNFPQNLQSKLQIINPKHVDVIDNVHCKDHLYDNIYSNNQLPRHAMDTKLSYIPPVSEETTLYNIDTHMNQNSLNAIHSVKNDRNKIINIGNISNTNDQNSSNFTQRCPTIFHKDQRNTSHYDLYMRTPQFSTTNFTPLEPQGPSRLDYTNAGATSLHIYSDNSNLIDLHMSSGFSYAAQSNFNHINESQYTGKMYEATCGNVKVMDNMNYCRQGPSDVHVSEMHKNYSPKLYEYTNNSTPSHFVTNKINSIAINDYKEKEIDIYGNTDINKLQKTKYKNFYNKTYASQPFTENYKKIIYSTEQSNLKEELPLSYKKFDNNPLNNEVQLSNVVHMMNDNSQTSNRTQLMSHKSHESFSYEILNNNTHKPSSSASVALSASKHRSFRINTECNTSQNTQINEYSNQQFQHNKDGNFSLNMPGKRDMYDHRNIYLNSKMTCFNTNKIQSLSVEMNSTQPTIIPNQKKSHIPKPNYKEMMYALRNSTNEDELNLKIIKKTLNVDPQVLRTSTSVTNIVTPAVSKIHSNRIMSTESLNHIPLKKSCYVYDKYSAEVPSTAYKESGINASYDKKQLNECTLKTEEKHNTSPLDLSMRTVKTKADSTEYKHQSFMLNSTQNINNKSALPKVDFTPNFSLHRDAEVILNERTNNSKFCVNVSKPEQRSIAHLNEFKSVSTLKSQTTSSELSQNTHPRTTYESTDVEHISEAWNSKLQDTLKAQVIIKSTIKDGLPTHNTDIRQIRRSVLKPNPYATNKIQHTSTKLKELNTLAVNHLPPETSIMTLSEITKHSKELTGSIEETCSLKQNTSIISKNSSVESIDRKRNIPNYSNLKYSEVHYKKGRYTDLAQTSGYNDEKDTNEVSVIERSLDIEPVKTAEKSIQAEILVSCYKTHDFGNVIKDETKDICKNKINFLTNPVDISKTMIKPEVMSSRIRTKAELKGFTFNSPIIQNTLIKDIKEEPLEYQIVNTNLPEISEEYMPNNLFDVNWSSACNNFVEQLKNRQPSNRDETSKLKLQNNSNYSDITHQINRCESTNINIFESKICLGDVFLEKNPKELTGTIKSSNKLDREKMRLQQEQRIAARLDNGSSSDSSNEFGDMKCERFKKPLRKGRVRRNKNFQNSFFNYGSDSSSDLEKNQLENSLYIKDKEQEKRIKNFINDDRDILTNNDSQFDSTNALIKNDANIKGNHNFIKSKTLITHRDQLKNEVQYDKNCSKNNTRKSSRQPKFISKINLNAMTRSKRKKELELQLANSKVLRNDKIIRNSTTKIKRKYVRKFVNQQNSFCQESKSDSMSTRLRSKLKNNTVVAKTNVKDKKSANKNTDKNIKAISVNVNGKEKNRDFLMEVYRYKRSLKIPPSLITIKPPGNHKTTTLLPFLKKDECDLPSINNCCFSDFGKNCTSSKSNLKHISIADEKLENQILSKHKSIIDVLHSRVINSSSTYQKLRNFKTKNIQNDLCTDNTKNVFRDKLDKCTHIKGDECEDEKKRHFSIFETKILQSKTRTESRLQQKRENIREIFVGNDRPASAPPEITQTSDCLERITYEQKYEQFLQQINEDSIRSFGETRIFDISFPSRVKVKQEEDTESNSAIDIEEKIDNESQSKLLKNCSFHRSYKRRKSGKYVRRRGSSGFDYIRKKKKSNPSSTCIGNSNLLPKSNIYNIGYLNKTKSEDDVCREIQKWVLNKGVGQSSLHKAARLGYIDVIVYCLDRMGINPDQKDNAGYTPLHEACTNGWLQIARVLLQYGANHSEAAHSGIRPLHEASENDHEEIVRLLLSYGADPMVATYSGQTPLMLASSTAMKNVFNNHLNDMYTIEPVAKPWKFNGPWEIFDPSEFGYDVMGEAPNYTCDMSRALRKSSISNLITNKNTSMNEKTISKSIMEKCAVVLDNIDKFNCIRLHNDNKPEFLVENSDSEGEIFEFEEADILLPPLYLLKNEGSDKWVLLNDLCNLLKVKSKDTLLNKICPASAVSSSSKNLTRELKMSDFLEKATCLQLLCAGEKINICASKVVLVKYSESVRNLLGVKTILMKF